MLPVCLEARVVKHTDKEHTHLHLVVNRIDRHGNAHNDSFISKESQTMADKVAIEHKLNRARVAKDHNLEIEKSLKNGRNVNQ